jgi:hypothetical protein
VSVMTTWFLKQTDMTSRHGSITVLPVVCLWEHSVV